MMNVPTNNKGQQYVAPVSPLTSTPTSPLTIPIEIPSSSQPSSPITSTNKYSTKIGHINIHGLHNLGLNQYGKINYIQKLMTKHQINIMSIVETHTRVEQHSTLLYYIKHRNFNYVERNRQHQHLYSHNRGSGGVAILSTPNWKLKTLYTGIKHENHIDDVLWVQATNSISNLNIYICTLYLVPKASIQSRVRMNDLRLQVLECGIHKFKHLGQIIIAGDFNIRIYDLPSLVYNWNDETELDTEILELKRMSNDQPIASSTNAQTDGKQLIDRFTENNIVICNGLEHFNAPSQYTYERHCPYEESESSSVIDYFGTIHEQLQNIRTVYVLIDEEICIDSDHNVLICQVQLQPDDDHTDACLSLSNIQSHSIDINNNMFELPSIPLGWKIDWTKTPDKYWETYTQTIENNLDQLLTQIENRTHIIQSVDQFNETITNKIYETMNQCFEKKKTIPHPSSNHTKTRQLILKPFTVKKFIFDHTIHELKQKRYEIYKNRIHQQYLESLIHTNDDNEKQFQKNHIRQLIGEEKSLTKTMKIIAKKNHIQQLDEYIEKTNTMKVRNSYCFWKNLKMLVDHTSTSHLPLPTVLLNDNNELVCDKKIQLHIWSQWLKHNFQSSSSSSDSNSSSTFDVDYNNQIQNELETILLLNQNDHTLECQALNEPIESEDIKYAINNLKRHSSAGTDSIISESIKYGNENMIETLRLLCDKIFQCEQIPNIWKQSIVCPIYKQNGDERDVMNYRPISLQNILSKVYTSLLYNRLSTFVESNNILSDTQFGFRPSRSTVDCIFILTECIQSRRQKNQKTYVCFIDFTKAYDSVDHTLLLYQLYKNKIRGKFLSTIQQLYTNVKSTIKLSSTNTPWIDLTAGVKQGCILSPILFNLFLNPLTDTIDALQQGIPIYNHENEICNWLSTLLNADDLALISSSRHGLELQLEALYQWARQHKMIVNIKKSAVIIFGPKSQIHNSDKFDYKYGNNEIIKVVKSYKYLGVELNNEQEFSLMKKRFCVKARASIGYAQRMGITGSHLPVKSAVLIYQQFIRSCLEYASPIWGHDQFPEAEIIQNQMLTRILNCFPNTSNAFLRGELGLPTLCDRRKMLRARYWAKLVQLPSDCILRQVYEQSRFEYENYKQFNWCMFTHKIFENYNLEKNWIADEIDDSFELTLENAAHEYEQKNWLHELYSKPKLRTYRIYKKELKFEIYLNMKENLEQRRGRIELTRLRSGTSSLRIETGRYERKNNQLLQPHQRLCLICNQNKVEDEYHFLFECSHYWKSRIEFFNRMKRLSQITMLPYMNIEVESTSINDNERIEYNQNRLSIALGDVGDETRDRFEYLNCIKKSIGKFMQSRKFVVEQKKLISIST